MRSIALCSALSSSSFSRPLPARLGRYSDDELRAIWLAADQLDAVEGGYVKLMMLLALRRDELALAPVRAGEFRGYGFLFGHSNVHLLLVGSAEDTKATLRTWFFVRYLERSIGSRRPRYWG